MAFKKFEYQEELMSEVRNGNSVVGNWARGAGKTFTLARILLEVKPEKVLYRTYNYKKLSELVEKIQDLLSLDENLKKSVSGIVLSNEEIKIEFHSGEKVLVSTDNTVIPNPDYVFMNDYDLYPLSEENNKYVMMVTRNNYNKELQKNHDCKIVEVDIYDLVSLDFYDKDFVRQNSVEKAFYREWAILSKRPSTDEISIQDFRKLAYQKLMKQFLGTADSKDTVLTRKNILEMIKDLKEIV